MEMVFYPSSLCLFFSSLVQLHSTLWALSAPLSLVKAPSFNEGSMATISANISRTSFGTVLS